MEQSLLKQNAMDQREARRRPASSVINTFTAPPARYYDPAERRPHAYWLGEDPLQPIQMARDHVPTAYTYMYTQSGRSISTNLNGPHTVPHTLLDFMVDHYNWIELFQEQVAPWDPKRVYGTLMNYMESYTDPAQSGNHAEEYTARITRYMEEYDRLYGWLAQEVNELGQTDSGYLSEEFGENLFRIMNMHPFGTYGWKQQQRVGHSALKGKGEKVIAPALQASLDMFEGNFSLAPPFLLPYLLDQNSDYSGDLEYEEFLNVRVKDFVLPGQWAQFRNKEINFENPKQMICETLIYTGRLFGEKCLHEYQKYTLMRDAWDSVVSPMIDRLNQFSAMDGSRDAQILDEIPAWAEQFQQQVQSIPWERPEDYQLKNIGRLLEGASDFDTLDLQEITDCLKELRRLCGAQAGEYIAVVENLVADMQERQELVTSCISPKTAVNMITNILTFIENVSLNAPWFKNGEMEPHQAQALYEALNFQVDCNSPEFIIFSICKEQIRNYLRAIGLEESKEYCVNMPF